MRTFQKCTADANLDIAELQGLVGIDDLDFAKTIVFLNAYFVGRLNADLRNKSVVIDHKNCVKSYKRICQIFDAVPKHTSV